LEFWSFILVAFSVLCSNNLPLFCQILAFWCDKKKNNSQKISQIMMNWTPTSANESFVAEKKLSKLIPIRI